MSDADMIKGIQAPGRFDATVGSEAEAKRLVKAVMFEVYYKRPSSTSKENALTSRVAPFGGRLDYREDATEHTGICLTYEFDTWEKAIAAAEILRQLGEHVEGPMDYAA